MNFTGTELTKKRNFYTQNANFGVGCDLFVDDPTGLYKIGISGAATNFEITLQSGFIKKDNLLLHSYRPFERMFLEFQVVNSGFNIIKNDTPLAFNNGKESGNYDYVYITREYSNQNADFNFFVSGDNVAEYQISQVGYWLNSGQKEVTGIFVNRGSYDIRVFDSAVQFSQSLDFNKLTGILAPSATGFFKYSGEIEDFNDFDFSQAIFTTFNTNFNDQEILFTIVDARALDRFVLFQDISDFNFDASNNISRTLTYSNYSGGIITNNFSSDLIFKLEFISGSGNFTIDDFATGAKYLTTSYGNFLQSGLFTGQAIIPTGNETLTGNYIINISEFGWATGAATGFFSGLGTGIASGLGYTGRAVGDFTGQITGFIYQNSGTLSINQVVTGFGLESLSLNFPNNISATGYVSITGLQHNDYFYIGVENTPLIKGLQFANETGLVFYLSGATEHKVSSYYSGDFVYLTALDEGFDGNGVFVRSGNCNAGFLWPYSEFLTGGSGIGATGETVYPIGQPYTGYISIVLTGSGDYSKTSSGNAMGSFEYTRTFTGAWDLLTGVDANNLVSLKSQGNYTDILISGTGFFPPNSTVNFQIEHDESEFNVDGIRLVISGSEVLNPIAQLINQ